MPFRTQTLTELLADDTVTEATPNGVPGLLGAAAEEAIAEMVLRDIVVAQEQANVSRAQVELLNTYMSAGINEVAAGSAYSQSVVLGLEPGAAFTGATISTDMLTSTTSTDVSTGGSGAPSYYSGGYYSINHAAPEAEMAKPFKPKSSKKSETYEQKRIRQLEKDLTDAIAKWQKVDNEFKSLKEEHELLVNEIFEKGISV